VSYGVQCFYQLAENKSPTTISSYLRGVRLYLGAHPDEFSREAIQQYLAECIADGKEPNTVRLRLAALRQFARWMVVDGSLADA